VVEDVQDAHARRLCHDKLNAASTGPGYAGQRSGEEGRPVIDSFALAISHGLILIAAWRLLSRTDLDNDDPAEPSPPSRPGSGAGA
jgi:hypothetical protein